MRIRKNKKARIIAVLFIAFLFMSVGYAFLKTELNTTATAVLKNKSYNVYYSNIQTTAGSVTPTTAPTTTGTSTTELNWAVNMDTPGQFYEFTVDVTNAGTVDAMIAELLNTTLTTEQAQYLNYTVTYEDYKPIEQYDKLAIGETDALRIRLEVKQNAQSSDIPSNPQIALNLGNIYAIADSNALARTKAVKYTVAFDKNNTNATGTMANQSIVQDRTTKLNANAFTRTGYHFTSWNTAANASGTSYTDEQLVTNLGDRTLYAQWAINTYTIAFDANGGTGTMASKSMTYGTASNLTANSFTRSGYTFKNWNTKADGTGTSYNNSQSVNNLTTEHGATVTLYAQWEEKVTKYAVQIYGINQDVDANGNTLGLTFGPATGASYQNSYVTHRYEETSEGSGEYYVKIVTHTVPETGSETTSEEYLYKNGGTTEKVTRTQAQVNARVNISLHDMTWAEIKAVPDKTLFEDCMLCGDTKSVKLDLNSTIASGTQQTARGDGAGTLRNTINTNYLKWNYQKKNARSRSGYSSSRIRATLIGSNSKTDTTYAGTDVLDSTTCLYSCIENDLKNTITAKKIKYVTGTSLSSYTLNDDIADSIWLFSEREMYGTGQYTGGNTEGVGTTGDGYAKFTNPESKYYISSASDGSNTKRGGFGEDGSSQATWLRSPLIGNDEGARILNGGSHGGISQITSYSVCGLAFGFCIQ